MFWIFVPGSVIASLMITGEPRLPGGGNGLSNQLSALLRTTCLFRGNDYCWENVLRCLVILNFILHSLRKLYFGQILSRYYSVFSSVGIATDYGLDGPGIESRWGEIFRPSRPALGPTQLLYNGYRVFPGGKVRPGRAADHSPPSSAAVMEE